MGHFERRLSQPPFLIRYRSCMLARRPTALVVFVAAVIMFALILAFFLWAAAGEARDIGSPISTTTVGSAPTDAMMTSSTTD